MSCGIRQHRPLSPLLFALALYSVNLVLKENTDIRGVLFKSRCNSQEFQISGYADDTVVNLHDHSLLHVLTIYVLTILHTCAYQMYHIPYMLHVLTILNEFAEVSGLIKNT